MKKWFLLLLVLAVVGLLMTASAEEPAINQNLGEMIVGADPTPAPVDPSTIPIVGEVLEVEEWEDLDEEEEEPEEELEWIEEEPEEEVVVEDEEVDIIEYIDLDVDNLTFPTLYCEVLEDTFELSKPEEGAPIVGGHYKGELLWVADLTGDYWMLEGGTYISADAVQIYNEDDIPGESEVKTRVNPRAPREMKVVLCDPASEIEDIVEKYHSVVIYDTVDNKLHCFKLGVETLEINLEPLSEYSPLYSFWSIDEDFLQEDAYAIGWEEVLAKVYQYTLPGSYLVIFQ